MLSSDVRHALRALGRSRGFTSVVIATLALGIGAATGMFSLVDAVLLRPLPFDQPDRLIAIWTSVPKDGLPRFRVSAFDYQEIRGQQGLFERLALTASGTATLTGSGDAAQLAGTRVTADFFPLLGVEPRLGRLFVEDDFQDSAPAVVVLSEALWVRRFGADPGILGRTVVLDGEPRVLVGVLPRQLVPTEARASGSVTFALEEEHVFTPLRNVQPTLRAHVYGVLGRLAAGVGVEQAEARLHAVARRLEAAHPDSHAGADFVVVPLVDEATGPIRSSLWTLFAAVAFVLAIACVNVSHLLLLRAAAREREIAVRAALGGSRGAIARLFLAEDGILAVAGGVLGLGVAAAVVRAVVAGSPVEVPRLGEASLDARAVLAALLTCVVVGIIVSLLPVLHWAARDPASALRAAGVAAEHGSATRRWRRALAAGETALAAVLVVGAGLLAKSFLRLQALDLGFQPGSVLVFDLAHPQGRYNDPSSLVTFYERLFERLRALPGVRSASASYDPPLASNWYQSFELPDRPPRAGEDRGALFRTVTPDYFRALGVELLEGRAFTDADDRGAPGAVIVNQALVRRFFSGESPLGRPFAATTTQWRWGERVPRTFRIVGVVEDETFGEPGAPRDPAFYLPFRQTPHERMSVLVRTSVDPESLVPEVRRVVRELDPALPVAAVTSLADIQSKAVARPRFRTLVLGAFAGSALLLALVGLAGVLGDSVAQRRREIAVRMALGAGARRVFWTMLGEGLRPAFLGMVVGLAMAVGLGRFLAAFLYGVEPADPQVYAVVAVALAAVGALACSVPAWRAARTQPAKVLHADT
jgi:putative ABC transport system permease protein